MATFLVPHILISSHLIILPLLSLSHFLRARRRRRALILEAMDDTAMEDWCMFNLTASAAALLVSRAPKTEVYTLRPPGDLPFVADFKHLSDEAFRATYRLHKGTFNVLLSLCMSSPRWQQRRRASHIPDEVWLGMVLEQLATGCTSRSLEHRHRVSGYSSRRLSVLASIIYVLERDPNTCFGFPDYDDDHGWRELANSFVPSIHVRFPSFYGTVAAADGTLIPIEPTGVSEMRRQSFRSRKV